MPDNVNPQTALGGPGPTPAAAGQADPTKPKIIVASAMAIAYGFLASLILTEYLKVASKAIYAGPRYSSLALVLLASVYLFYMIFDTLVWLAHYEKNPLDIKQRPKKPRAEVVRWLVCRITEFILLIWLYDFVNVLEEVTTQSRDLTLQLARLCFDIGCICSGWAFWFAVFLGTDISKAAEIDPGDCPDQIKEKKKDQQERRENWQQLSWHLVFAAIFYMLWAWFTSDRKPPQHVAFLLAYVVTCANIARIYLVQKGYYDRHWNLYMA